MLWASWTTIQLCLVSAAVVAFCFREPRLSRRLLFAASGFALVCLIAAPRWTAEVSASLRASLVAVIVASQLDRILLGNATMIFTSVAVVWLLHRAYLTIRKPVERLINTLSVEVPDAPDVSLAAIGVDKATVTWTRAPANRPVQKFVIQVNGIYVGDSATNQDTFITVSGLKPNHYYNVRIIAVGHNNHQTGSRLLRLRTFNEEGRPQLGTARLPAGFEETARAKQAEGTEENSRAVATFGTAQGLDPSSAAARDVSSSSVGTAPTTRRNTGGRRHSPSVNSLDRPPIQLETNGQSEAQMAELNQRYLALRRETDEATAGIAREEDETRRQLEDLETEKRERRKEQKKKEEQTEKLKKEQGMTDRSMRAAEKQKAQKEKTFKEKQTELKKLRDSMSKGDKGIADMNKEQESYEKQKVGLAETRETKGSELQNANGALKKECAHLENQLKGVRRRVKYLEDARKDLPGHEEDAGWHGSMLEFRKDWQRREIKHRNELLAESQRQQQLNAWIHQLKQLRSAQQQNGNFGYEQGNSSAFDFDGPHGRLQRRSRNSVSLSNPAVPSPVQAYHGLDHTVSSAPFEPSLTSAPSGFVTGPFMGHSADGMDPDSGLFRTLTDAPLSPSATNHLLPSGIFTDDEPTSLMPQSLGAAAMLPMHNVSPDNDPQSPASSGRSASLLSSRQGSSNNLAYTHEMARPLGPLESPRAAPGQPVSNRLGNLFRHRAAKGLDEGGPALGTLKAGQSQSFPRQAEDVDVTKGRRGLATSQWNPFNRNSAGPELFQGHTSPAWRTGFSARNLLPFGPKPASGVHADRDPSSPRPASIASSDMPRPSTDSASIWGPPGDAALSKPSHLWPSNGWSRNPSRRPSIHGSANALKTNLASAEDEILGEAELQNPQVSPSQVGVIGSRPPAAKKSLAKSLNPTAQPFKTIFRNKADKDKEGGKDREKSKGKDKDRSRDKGKGKGKDAPPETPQTPSILVDESPSESRISRDALSLHTQTDVSESRESLSMEHSISQVSHTTSEPTAGPKDPDSAFRKLFRKDSTSKLSFSQKFKRSKGPGSVTNSEKNMSNTERSSMGDGDEAAGEAGTAGGGVGGIDSVTSSPSLGPAKFKDKPESKLKPSGSWFSSIKKKNRDKESSETDHASVDTAGD